MNLPQLAVLASLSLACAGSTANVKPEGSGLVTFNPAQKTAVGTRLQRTENSNLEMMMELNAGGMHTRVPMTLRERQTVQVARVDDSRTRVTFSEKTSTQQMGTDPAETEQHPLQGQTLIVEHGGTPTVRTEDGRAMEGPNAQEAIEEATYGEDETLPSGEVSFEMNTELPFMSDVLAKQFASGADGDFKPEKVSVMLIEQTPDSGVFKVALRGALATSEGVVDMDLTGTMEMMKAGMRVRHMEVAGPIKMNTSVATEGGPVQVAATGKMSFRIDEQPLTQ